MGNINFAVQVSVLMGLLLIGGPRTGKGPVTYWYLYITALYAMVKNI